MCQCCPVSTLGPCTMTSASKASSPASTPDDSDLSDSDNPGIDPRILQNTLQLLQELMSSRSPRVNAGKRPSRYDPETEQSQKKMKPSSQPTIPKRKRGRPPKASTQASSQASTQASSQASSQTASMASADPSPAPHNQPVEPFDALRRAGSTSAAPQPQSHSSTPSASIRKSNLKGAKIDDATQIRNLGISVIHFSFGLMVDSKIPPESDVPRSTAS